MNAIKNPFEKSANKASFEDNMISEPELVELKDIPCIGYSITTSVEGDRKKEDIPPFFHQIYDNNKLDPLWNQDDRNMFCIFNMHKNGKNFDYFIATENKLKQQKTDYAKITIPKGKYATVQLLKKNHTAVSEIMMFLQGVWMKAYGFKPAQTPAFILYDERFHTNYQLYGSVNGNYPGKPIATLYMPVKG